MSSLSLTRELSTYTNILTLGQEAEDTKKKGKQLPFAILIFNYFIYNILYSLYTKAAVRWEACHGLVEPLFPLSQLGMEDIS